MVKEAHHLTLRLLACRHDEQLLLMLAKESFNEGRRVPYDHRSFHREPGLGMQLFRLTLEEFRSLLLFVLRPLLHRLHYFIHQYLLFNKMGG